MTSTRSSSRKFLLRHPVVVDVGCNCRKPKLSSFFSLPKHNKNKNKHLFSPSTTTTTTTSNWGGTTQTTTSSFSPYNDTSSTYTTPKKKQAKSSTTRKKNNYKRVVEESVAVEKESSDPYLDFRDSMLQMIVEKEIYALDDLRELLHRMLSLNSPYHHQLIMQAFTEIWDGVFSPNY